jgi:hypothetical protein
LGATVAGDTVLFKSGTYNAALVDLIPSGSAGNVVTVQSESNHGAILQPHTGTAAVIGLNNANSYITINGFVVDGISNGSNDGIRFSAASFCEINHVSVINNEIKNAGEQGFQTGHGCFLTVTGNSIHDNARLDSSGLSHAIYAIAQDSTFANNELYNHPNGYCFHFYNGFGGPGLDRNIVKYNSVHGCGATNGQAGILVSGSAMQVYGNLIYGNANGVWGTQGGTTVSLLSNTIYGNTSDGILNTTLSALTCTNNIVIGNGTQMTGCNSSTTNITTGTPTDLMNNPAGGDFTIKAGSAAIGAGTNLSGTFTTDYAGTTWTVPWGVSAYQFVAGGTPIVTKLPSSPTAMRLGSSASFNVGLTP